MKVTRWSPDTCRCVFEYEWDETTKEDNRTHTLKTVVNRCSEHALADQALFDAVIDENKTKNAVVTEIISLTTLTPEDIIFSYTLDRKLEIALLKEAGINKNKLEADVKAVVGNKFDLI